MPWEGVLVLCSFKIEQRIQQKSTRRLDFSAVLVEISKRRVNFQASHAGVYAPRGGIFYMKSVSPVESPENFGPKSCFSTEQGLYFT